MGVLFTHFTLRTQQSPLFHMTVLFPHFTLRTQHSPLFKTFCKSRSHIILIRGSYVTFHSFKTHWVLNHCDTIKVPDHSRIAKLLHTFLPVWDKPAHESSQLSSAIQISTMPTLPRRAGYIILFPDKNVRIGSYQIQK